MVNIGSNIGMKIVFSKIGSKFNINFIDENFFMKKLICFLYFYSTLLYIIFTVSMVHQGRQNMNKINVFRPVSEQNFISE
jgi:hypothetical protein